MPTAPHGRTAQINSAKKEGDFMNYSRFNRSMNAGLVAGLEQRHRHFRLHKGFTTKSVKLPPLRS